MLASQLLVACGACVYAAVGNAYPCTGDCNKRLRNLPAPDGIYYVSMAEVRNMAPE